MARLDQTLFFQLSLPMVVVEGIQQVLRVLLLAVDLEAVQVTLRRGRLEQPIKDMLVEMARRVLILAAVAAGLDRLVLLAVRLAPVLAAMELQVQ
jgi:hypothetical protein